jgi:hypothetical protein
LTIGVESFNKPSHSSFHYMNMNHLSSKDLKKALKLLERKESHQARIAAIERQIDELCGAQGRTEIQVAKAPRAVASGKRGQVKEAIIGLLQKTGSNGISLKEICRRLDLSQSRLNSWLHSTGSKIGEIKKVGRGEYAWIE